MSIVECDTIASCSTLTVVRPCFRGKYIKIFVAQPTQMQVNDRYLLPFDIGLYLPLEGSIDRVTGKCTAIGNYTFVETGPILNR